MKLSSPLTFQGQNGVFLRLITKFFQQHTVVMHLITE